jgi:hypothetical protein
LNVRDFINIPASSAILTPICQHPPCSTQPKGATSISSTSPLSEAQLNANRQNAANSTGPRTDSGKKRTRLNCLTGQTVVMPHENREIYESFCARQIACLQPAHDTERALNISIADDSSKLNPASAIEENMFALAEYTALDTREDAALQSALTQAQKPTPDHAREIQLLTVHAGPSRAASPSPKPNSPPSGTNAKEPTLRRSKRPFSWPN